MKDIQPNNIEDGITNSDQIFVSNSYKQASQLQPPENIDAAILAKAKFQVVSSVTATQRDIPLWRKWQFGSSIAASVAIVVFFFLINPMPTEYSEIVHAPLRKAPAQPPIVGEAEQASEELQSIKARMLENEMVTNQKSPHNKLVSEDQSIDSEVTAVEDNNGVEAFQTRDLLQVERERKIVEEDSTDNVKYKLSKLKGSSAVPFNDSNRKLDESEINSAKEFVNRSPEKFEIQEHADIEAIEVAGARVTIKLEQIIIRLAFIQRELSLNNAQIFNKINQTESDTNEQTSNFFNNDPDELLLDYKNMQSDLYKQLKFEKQANETWLLEEQYLPFLKDNEIEVLTANND